MTGFSADWLSLREPVDRRSRNREILAAIESYFRGRPSVTVTDLACGRGSLLRALSDHLPAKQMWRLIDNDEALLSAVQRELCGTIEVQSRLADLDKAIEDIVGLETNLLASSAFIDLVSERWLMRLSRSVSAASVPVYLALNYDGHVTCHPEHPLDDAVMAAFHRHQQRDKGFGPALGPQAADVAAQQLAARGFETMVRRADWRLDDADRAVQDRLVAGWFDAVDELAALPRADLADWRDRRLAWIADGRSVLVVGHVDIWAVPPVR